MAGIPMQYVGGVYYKTVATSAENQTWAKQLSDIKSAYNSLSNDDKMKCIIVSYVDIFIPGTISGDFRKFFVNSSGATVVMYLNINNTTYQSGAVSSNVTDYSSSSHNRSMELKVLSMY